MPSRYPAVPVLHVQIQHLLKSCQQPQMVMKTLCLVFVVLVSLHMTNLGRDLRCISASAFKTRWFHSSQDRRTCFEDLAYMHP